MKKAKLILLSILLCFGIVFVSACDDEKSPVLADGIFVSETEIELTLGEFATIEVTITPDDVTSKDFEVLALTQDVVEITYDKPNMQFTINAPNEIPNGFNTIELEVRTTDGSDCNKHLTVKLNERLTPIQTPKDLHLNGTNLVWTEVVGAKGYIMNINGVDMPIVYTNSYAVDQSLVGTDVVARVYAVAEDDSLSSGFAEYTFKILNAPTNLTYEDGTITWDTVDGATGYNVYFDGKISFTEYAQSYVLDRFTEPKTYQIKVMAVGDDSLNIENSDYCEAIEITKLDIPKNIRIVNGVVLWNEVQNIKHYTIYLDNEEPVQITRNQLVLPQNLTAGSHFIKIQSCGDEKTYISSVVSPQINFEKLSPVASLYIENGSVCWTANLQATSYMLYVNGMPYQTTNINTTNVDFVDYNSGTYSLNIKPIGNGGNILDGDLMADSFEATKLATPNNLRIEAEGQNNYLVWDEIENASAYALIINDAEPLIVEGNKYLLQVQAGSYNAKVRALGDNTSFINSNYSSLFTTTKLASVNNLSVQNGKIIWDLVSGAGKYQILINNDLIIETTNNRFDMISTPEQQFDAGIYTVAVKPIANITTNINGNYCDNISVTKLKTPQVAVRFGQLVDAVVENASVIEYKINVLSSTGQVVNSLTKNTLEGVGSDSLQQYQITAKALAPTPASAQDVYYVNSDVSQTFSCWQLPKITDITITNGVVSFGETTYQNLTEGFTFNLSITDKNNTDSTSNNQVVTLGATQKQYDFKNLDVSTYSYNLTVTPNYNQNGESLLEQPFLTSKTSIDNTFTILGAPQNAKISSVADIASSVEKLVANIYSINSNPTGTLIWDKVENATRYSVKIDGVEKLITTSTSSDLLGILQDDGVEHKITVQAIGNGTDIISSAVSTEVSCVKLNRPTNLQCNGSSISWQSEYNQNLGTFDLMNSDVNIVIYVAVINGNEYITLDTSNLGLANIADKLSSKEYKLPKLVAGEYTANVYAIPLNAYVTMGGEVLQKQGTQYVVSELNTNELNLISLIAPQGLSMSEIEDKQMLTWSPLLYENGEVAEYVVTQKVDETETTYPVANNITEWQFKDYVAGRYSFTVYAKATAGTYFEKNGKKYYYVDSEMSNMVVSTVMKNPELFVTNGVIHWTEIEGVDEYWLTFGKQGETQQTQIFPKENIDFKLGSDYTSGNYTFKILAKGNGFNYITSVYSAESIFTKLEIIQNLRLENGIIKYDQNAMVSSQANECYYSISVNGKEFSNNKLLATELEGFGAGEYQVNIYAHGDSTFYLTSNVSQTISCTKLSTPYSVSIDSGLLKWTKSNNASSYQLNISGSIVEDITGVTYDFTELDCGDYQVSVKAVGNSTSYVNSDWASTKVISKLDEIKNLRVENGVITWDAVNGSYNNIKLKIKLATEAEYQEISIPTDSTTYVLDKTYIAGTYNVCMYNAGGTTAISSTETDVIPVVKLQSPENLRISTEDDLQYIEFDSVANAGSYTLSIKFGDDGNEQIKEITITSTKLATSELANYDISIESSGTYVLGVKANGTVAPYVNSNFSNDLTITKPQAPVLVDIKTTEGMSSGMVTWDAVQDADYYRVVMQKDGVVTDEFTTEKTHLYVSNKANYTISVTSCKDLNGFDSETTTLTLSYALYDGSGSKTDPYRVKTAVDFNNMTYNLTAYYQLVNNIDFSATVLNAICSQDKQFEGTLDGNGFAVTGVSITTYSSNRGLVPVLATTGQIINLTVNANITSGQTVGGIVAVNYGLIQNCVVNGSISPIYNVSSAVLNAGGIAGINNGQIVKCVNNASVNPQNNLNITYAGGITATNNGTISGCGNNSDVSATYAGGIVAYSVGNISYSYNNYNARITATAFNNGITCYAYAGGIAGYISSSTTDAIQVNTCYNVGTVVATSAYNAVYPYAGGLIGYNSGAKVVNCYSTIVNEDGDIIISVQTNNNGRGYAGVLVGFNEKGTIAHNNLSILANLNQVDCYTNSGFINRIRYVYTDIDETTIINNLSGYEESEGIFPTIANNAKY